LKIIFLNLFNNISEASLSAVFHLEETDGISWIGDCWERPVTGKLAVQRQLSVGQLCRRKRHSWGAWSHLI